MRSKWLAIARQPIGATALVLVGLLVLLAIFAPILWGEAAEMESDDLSAPAPDGSTRIVPSYPMPEDGVRALAAATNYAEWGLTYVDRNGRQVFLNTQFN